MAKRHRKKPPGTYGRRKAPANTTAVSDEEAVPQQASNSTTASPLLRLPTEITTLIFSHCNYASALALHMSCKTLMSEFSKPTTYDVDDLLQLETWPCHDRANRRKQKIRNPIGDLGLSACRPCLQLRSPAQSSNFMMKGTYAKPLRTNTGAGDRAHRKCIDCGIRDGTYRPGVQFEYGDSRAFVPGLGTGLVCWTCQRFVNIKDSKCDICKSCMTRLGVRDGMVDDMTNLRNEITILQDMAAELQKSRWGPARWFG